MRVLFFADVLQRRTWHNAWTITFPVFKAQVWSYLHPDYQAQYNSAELWDNMVLRVVEALARTFHAPLGAREIPG